MMLSYVDIHFVSPCRFNRNICSKADSTNNSENEHNRSSYYDADPLINISRYLFDEKWRKAIHEHEDCP